MSVFELTGGHQYFILGHGVMLVIEAVVVLTGRTRMREL